MKWCTKLNLRLSAKPIRYVLLFGHTYKSFAGSASSPQISTMIPQTSPVGLYNKR